MKPVEEFLCELNLSLEANTEMVNDNISEIDIKETILNGIKTQNNRGSGYKYQYRVIVVIADDEPCHYYVITVWKTNSEKPTYKNKPYRRRRYMKRRQKPCSRCGKAEFRSGIFPVEISGEIYGKFEGYECPNCGMLYFTEQSSRKIREIVSQLPMKPLSSDELVLVLLCASREPIKGAVSFMKEAFLLFKEKLKDFKIPALSPHFIPYHYGPYSFDIVEAWYKLDELGLISIEGRRSSNKETFRLTEEGLAEAKKVYDSLPNDLKNELPRWRRGLDELGNDGILKDVYLKYKEYTDKSKIKRHVLPSGMHRRA